MGNNPEYQRAWRAERRKEWGDGEWWFVYYLPEEHYCGIANNPVRRIDEHRAKRQGNKNTKGWRILFATKDVEEACRTEAEFHLMGMNGADWGKKYKKHGII